jgi:hypothetical protein
MHIANKVVLCLLLLLVSSTAAVAQQCTDSDRDGTTAGNNPLVRGNVTVVSPAGVRSEYPDSCDASGKSLREFFCANSGGVTSVVHQGLFGCLDGAIIKEHTNTPACFTDIILAITPSASSSAPPTLSILEATRQIDRLWWATARARPQPNDPVVEVVIKDVGGQIIATRYSSIVPEYFDIPATRGISRVTLPFIPLARSFVFRAEGAELSYTLPAHLLTCSRKKVPIGLSGIEGIDSCVSEGQKFFINPTTFTCRHSTSPSPSPSAATR